RLGRCGCVAAKTHRRRPAAVHRWHVPSCANERCLNGWRGSATGSLLPGMTAAGLLAFGIYGVAEAAFGRIATPSPHHARLGGCRGVQAVPPSAGMAESDLATRRGAVAALEHPGLAARLTNMVGKPIELIGYALPASASQAITAATTKALEIALEVALR